MYVTVPNEAQIVEAMALARCMHADSLYGYLPWVDGKVIETAALALESPRQLLLVVIDDSDDKEQVVGIFLGRWDEFFFNRERVATDQILYVDPRARGKTVATLLIQAYRDWAYSEGCCEAVLSHSTGYDVSPFFERMGFKAIGAVHKLKLEG